MQFLMKSPQTYARGILHYSAESAEAASVAGEKKLTRELIMVIES